MMVFFVFWLLWRSLLCCCCADNSVLALEMMALEAAALFKVAGRGVYIPEVRTMTQQVILGRAGKPHFGLVYSIHFCSSSSHLFVI